MGRLYVCPLSKVAQVVAETGAERVVSLLGPAFAPPRLERLAPGRHLALGLSDITEAREGHVLAGADHIETLIAFIRAWDRARPLVVHCYAGVSRSPAAAYIAACALTSARESDIAQNLRRLSPSATPNPHFIALADSILSRQGRMVAAIESIGRGADCFEGDVFFMDMQ
ncbi:tyrosine phosphatase family protein [Rhodoblastus sp.]|uniref:tyrosine phosphatase family protein n=1 Tax=Rhodoblastus sp. TaxID=1962975 RepID=UPI0035AE708A